jgi:hypothetical protein
MSKGFDCASALTTASSKLFISQGYTFVGRYLADASSWKRLSLTEAKVISDSGLYIVSFMERYSDRVCEGASAGTEDGKLGLQYAKEVNQPEGSTIYYCVDCDAQSSNYDAIEAYLRAADKEIVGYELGVYGSYSVVKEMYERGVCKKLAQTVAWSHGRKYENANFYQSQIDITANGLGIDLDETNGDAGGWKIGMAIKQSNLLEDNDSVTDYILAVLGDYYKRMQGNPDVQSYTHVVANALRVAVGRPTE